MPTRRKPPKRRDLSFVIDAIVDPLTGAPRGAYLWRIFVGRDLAAAGIDPSFPIARAQCAAAYERITSGIDTLVAAADADDVDR